MTASRSIPRFRDEPKPKRLEVADCSRRWNDTAMARALTEFFNLDSTKGTKPGDTVTRKAVYRNVFCYL
jgi:hypothetical protein